GILLRLHCSCCAKQVFSLFSYIERYLTEHLKLQKKNTVDTALELPG
ncbi:hypothetical protein X975_00676, partial [Stegodyphus mimosarum]